MYVYVIYLDGRGPLTAAFDRAMDCEDVVSCSIEPELGRLRFIAPAKAAEELMHRIYLDGGMRWCSGHELDPAP